MSKRFGRQQKRKMRASVERLELDNKMIKHSSRRNDEIVRNTAEILGRHFCGLDPEIMGVSYAQEVIERGLRIHGCSRVDMGAVAFDHISEPSYIVEHLLPVIHAEHMEDNFDGSQHFKVSHGDKVVGYAISAQGLSTMGHRIALQRISREIAEQLLREHGI